MTSPEPDAPAVSVERTGSVLTVTIDRRHKLNALDRDTALAIARAAASLDADDAVGAGMITGAGGVFSAGFDLGTFRDDAHPDEPTLPAAYVNFIEQGTRKPLVGAVEGYALGGGLELALTCDILVASRGAQLGLPEVMRGLLAGGGGLLRLRDRIPRNEAMAIALLGERMSAERAFDLGLVHELVDDGEARECGIDLARRIAKNAPLAVAASKRVIIESRDWPQREAFARQSRIADAVMASEDAREGALAFMERRDPQWKGR